MKPLKLRKLAVGIRMGKVRGNSIIIYTHRDPAGHLYRYGTDGQPVSRHDDAMSQLRGQRLHKPVYEYHHTAKA